MTAGFNNEKDSNILM